MNNTGMASALVKLSCGDTASKLAETIQHVMVNNSLVQSLSEHLTLLFHTKSGCGTSAEKHVALTQ